jgi:predicted RND superfamily exporter protein
MFVFFLYFRSKRGMFLPILAAAISAIWGLGFLSLFGYNLDPLVLVFPFLISAMAASHAVQVIKRYMEEAQKNKDVKKSCKNVIEHLFLPGFAGIITDASGIVVIALTPIPILHKICLSCAYWAIVTIVIAMLLVPILLSYMPVRNLKQEQDFLDRLLQRIGAWIVGTGKYFVFTVSVLLLIVCSFFVNDVDIGHNFPGSELLWPWHRYNIDCTRIGFAMGTLLPLYVVAEGEEHQAIVDANVIRDIVSFSRHLEQTPDKRVLQAMSVIKTISSGHQMMRDNNLNWCFVPTKDSQASAIYRAILYQSGPGTWDKFIDRRDKTANIVVLCRDKTAETIRIVIERINDYIRNKSIFGIRQKDIERKGFDRFIYWVDGFFREKEAPIPEKPLPEGVPKVHYRLAGGSVGMQAAINEALTLYQIWTFILALMIVFILCSVIFRSFFAGMIITLPLVLANFLTFTLMSFGAPYISLTTATMPIASIGIGLGVDYGIYLVSRIIEEYKNNTSLEYAIKQALGTTGKAIIYIATTLMCGIMFWFFSKMMFQAMMGLLLGTILLFNMLGALLIIPSFIAIFKPKFVTGKIKTKRLCL